MNNQFIIEEYQCIEKYLQKYAEENPEKNAVIVKDVYTSYGELWKHVRAFSGYLKKECGVRKGDCVVVKTMQTLNYAIAYFSTHLAGGIFVPLEKSISEEKAKEILEETEAVVYISKDALNGDNWKYIDLKNVENLALAYSPDAWDGTFPKLEDSADIMYTTGTTGKAKGVEVTHQVLLATAENYITGFELKSGNVIVVPGPMNHVNPLRKLYMSIMSGNTIIILNGLMSMKGFYHALDEQGATSLCLPPASLRLIWQASGNKLAEYADQIDFVECSTAPVTEADKKTLREQLPYSRLYNNYGLSECGAMVMYDFNAYPDKGAGCVGRPMVNSHVIIVDDERKEIISSKENMGLLANSGLINMKGYWKRPDLTKQVLSDGYVYTNDIAYFDEEGFLYVVGRRNDTINVGGLKVEPTDVEEAAMSFEEVHECICVPMDDPVTGSALKLFVVTKSGGTLNEAELRKYMSSRLATYQLPKVYEVTDSIPRNFVGKPDRNAFVNGEKRSSYGKNFINNRSIL